MNMGGNLFPTLTPPVCAALIQAARKRRRPDVVRARIFAGPMCPVCGRPGLHRDLTGGTEITHGAGIRCWWPAACGSVEAARRAQQFQTLDVGAGEEPAAAAATPHALRGAVNENASEALGGADVLPLFLDWPEGAAS